MKEKIAFVAGSTGLIGNILVRNLLEDDYFSKVITIGRRESEHSHPKLEHHIVDFNQLLDYQAIKSVDIAFCCLGTTMNKAGSKEAFYKVDYTYVVDFAKFTAQAGGQQFCLVSAMGADKSSFLYYNQVKGKVEEAVQTIGFEALHIMRPSLLLGDREEQRLGEKIGTALANAFSFLIPDNYKGVEASSVATYMMQLTKQAKTGVHIHASAEIRQNGN